MIQHIKELWGILLLILVLAGALIVVDTMNSKEDPKSPEMSDLERSIERHKQLEDVFRRVERAVSQSTGPEKELLSQRLEMLEEIDYFNEASLNCGEPIRFLGVISDRRDDLTAMGATGTVAALDKLTPLYDKWMELHHKSDRITRTGKTIEFYEESDESNAFLEENEEEIQRHTSLAEGGEELKQLLIEAARKTLREFGYESLN